MDDNNQPFSVALVGCGKAKGLFPAPARELYASALFKHSLRLAELETHSRLANVRIISARWGAVEPDKVLVPYELALGSMSPKVRGLWSQWVGTILAREYGGAQSRVLCLMGSDYARAVRRQLPHWNLVAPMEGMGMGQRLKWLKWRIQEISRCACGHLGKQHRASRDKQPMKGRCDEECFCLGFCLDVENVGSGP